MFYKTRRVLQGISEQKLKPPSSPGSAVFVLKAVSNINMYMYHLGSPKSYSLPFVFQDSICQIRNTCEENISSMVGLF